MQKISICQGSRGTKAQRAVDINSQEAQHLQLGQQPLRHGGGSIVMGVPNSWMVYFMGNPSLKWMIWGISPFQETSTCFWKCVETLKVDGLKVEAVNVGPVLCMIMYGVFWIA